MTSANATLHVQFGTFEAIGKVRQNGQMYLRSTGYEPSEFFYFTGNIQSIDTNMVVTLGMAWFIRKDCIDIWLREDSWQQVNYFSKAIEDETPQIIGSVVAGFLRANYHRTGQRKPIPDNMVLMTDPGTIFAPCTSIC